VDVSKYLISMGADIILRTSQDWMPLHYAALNGDVEMSDILLSSGADATAVNAVRARLPV
jgi:ankyrin repeat protein